MRYPGLVDGTERARQPLEDFYRPIRFDRPFSQDLTKGDARHVIEYEVWMAVGGGAGIGDADYSGVIDSDQCRQLRLEGLLRGFGPAELVQDFNHDPLTGHRGVASQIDGCKAAFGHYRLDVVPIVQTETNQGRPRRRT